MSTETLLAISAGATLVLAIAAFLAIWQNYRFRKQDRDIRIKATALDNIHQWLDEIVNNFSKALSDAFFTLGKTKLEMSSIKK